jgi:hypothetical protein
VWDRLLAGIAALLTNWQSNKGDGGPANLAQTTLIAALAANALWWVEKIK